VSKPYIAPDVSLPDDFEPNPGSQSNLEWSGSMSLELAAPDHAPEGDGLAEDQALAFLARRVRPLPNETQGVVS
jgi:hypothetical protein